MRVHRKLHQATAALAGSPLAATGVLAFDTATTSAQEPPPDVAQTQFQQVTLVKGEAEMGEPMTLAVLPDRSVPHISRDGTLRRTDANGSTSVAGQLPVYGHDEEGLRGIGVDPGFESNRFICLYYAPPLDTPGGDAPADGSAADFAPFDGVNRLSRFTLSDDNTLDLDSETEILDVAASRGQCRHVGGDIDFDAEGNLYLSTGDDPNPFASDGFTPIDERPDRNSAFDGGPALGAVDVPATGGWDQYVDVSTTLSGQPDGTTTLYLTFSGRAGGLLDIDDFTFSTGE
ncbi:hypothetical protein DEH69_02930 [Streptomyces sp. PT12]|nr:hypothetical protein DEH69_02930 [Streptomyces sp. PT12]